MVKSILNPVGGGFADFYESNGLNKFLVSVFIKMPTAVVVGSKFWNDYFNDAFPNIDIYDIPNPVHSSKFSSNLLAKSPSQLKIVMVSRLTKEKGVEELVSVIKEVCALSNKFLFVIMGKGDKLGWLQLELENEIGRGMVDIKGPVSEEVKIEELSTADIYILLTHFEATPISILEAMSASLPILSTNVGGIPEIVRNGENGYLFERMVTKPVAEKLIELSKNKSMLKGMGEKSLEMVFENYEIHSVIKKHFAVMNKL